MSLFEYPESEKRECLTLDEAHEKLTQLAGYLAREHEKGKIPLIVAGAGISSSSLMGAETDKTKQTHYDRGLPCLSEMIRKIQQMIEETDSEDPELKKLRAQFDKLGPGNIMDQIDREWIGKLFVTLSDNGNDHVHRLWDRFCQWFFFSCCEDDDGRPGGALNIKTSQASQEIANLYKSLDAICLSANFDDFLEFALTGVAAADRGISLFKKKYVDRYFRRCRRDGNRFSNTPHNRCVIHANGDVLWLHCGGDKDEGYCPRRGKYFPAFYERKDMTTERALSCPTCGSKLEPTMTMPGTYEKDYKTRKILSSIWEHLATKISCVITVGLSCNWDDVLLKFILGLLLERQIPHLDINDFSEAEHTQSTAITRQIVREKRFQSCGIQADACEGLRALNKAVENAKPNSWRPPPPPANIEDVQKELIALLENYDEVQKLRHVSQLGLKPLSVRNAQGNDRWEHSKEVAQIACTLYLRLCENSKKEYNSFEYVLLCAAGLLHDCGHLPFSHLLEDVFEELSWSVSGSRTTFKHSQYSKFLVRKMCSSADSALGKFLAKYGVAPEEVVRLIEGEYGIGYLDTLINSAIDADKIAYIFTDAEQMERALMLKKEDFIQKIAENAYITQEGFVALDGMSAWFALRLLDERKRMYEELYLDPNIRGMETAAKYIITTYFVQKYNQMKFNEQIANWGGNLQTDLGEYRIMLAAEDLTKMCTDDYLMSNFSASIGKQTQTSLRTCMSIIQKCLDLSVEQSLEEWNILKKMFHQLTGEEWTGTDSGKMICAYHDTQIQELADGMNYQKLAAVRKKITLNYPGLVLIDLHKPVHYYSTPEARRRRYRLDGTNCAQDTILFPDSPRASWQEGACHASIPLSEYAASYGNSDSQRSVFQVFKIGSESADCEHAVNMLKKELQNQSSKKETVI